MFLSTVVAEDLVLNELYVLVVDPSLDSRELLAFVLEQQGAEVVTATCLDEAIALVGQRVPDVLLSEIALPEQDGYALMRQVSALVGPHLSPIVAIATTGYAELEARLLSLEAGFQAHVAKPIDFKALTALLLEMKSAMRLSSIEEVAGRVPDL